MSTIDRHRLFNWLPEAGYMQTRVGDSVKQSIPADRSSSYVGRRNYQRQQLPTA